MTTLQLTETGTPNTCCKCGEMQHVAWYAEHDDKARSGEGLCANCAGIKPEPLAKPKTRQKTTTRRKRPAKKQQAAEQ